MNKVHVSLVARAVSEPRTVRGNNDRGPWSFDVVEIIDAEFNKVEVTLPDDGYPALAPWKGDQAEPRFRFDCEISVRKGFLSVKATRVIEVDADGKPVAAVRPVASAARS